MLKSRWDYFGFVVAVSSSVVGTVACLSETKFHQIYPKIAESTQTFGKMVTIRRTFLEDF
jgi:hypothetical protein